jgi:hypothetical protein
MASTDPIDGGTHNPFAGTPVGGQPHWFARPRSRGPFDGQVADTLHDGAVAATGSAVIAGVGTYLATRDPHRAVRAAVITWPYMFAIYLLAVFGGLSWIVLLVEACLLFGDYGLSVFCFVVATLCTWAVVALIRSYRRRMNGLLSGPASGPRLGRASGSDLQPMIAAVPPGRLQTATRATSEQGPFGLLTRAYGHVHIHDGLRKRGGGQWKGRGKRGGNLRNDGPPRKTKKLVSRLG